MQQHEAQAIALQQGPWRMIYPRCLSVVFYGLYFSITLFALSGCASNTRIRVASLDETNEGRSLYVLVRDVDSDELVAEGYDEAAKWVFTREAVPGVKARHVIIPGQELSLDIEDIKGSDIALYFFFTRPADRWWFTVNRKRLPAEVVVELGRNEIERVGVRTR